MRLASVIWKYVRPQSADDRIESYPVRRSTLHERGVEVVARCRRNYRLRPQARQMLGDNVSDLVSQPLHRREIQIKWRL
jgi:hypothetical protein